MVKRMDKLKIFENAEFGQTRTITIDNESWFCGKDVASSLGYVNTKKALLDHCKEPRFIVIFCYILGKLNIFIFIKHFHFCRHFGL